MYHGTNYNELFYTIAPSRVYLVAEERADDAYARAISLKHETFRLALLHHPREPVVIALVPVRAFLFLYRRFLLRL